MCGRYKLSVMVKDMAGKVNAFFTTGIVTVEVTGNTWASPDPVRFQENFPGPYPIPISQVRHKPNDHLLSSLWDTSGCTFHIEVGSDPFVKHFPAITLQSSDYTVNPGLNKVASYCPAAVFNSPWVPLSDQRLNNWCCSNATNLFRLTPDWVSSIPVISHNTATHQPPSPPPPLWRLLCKPASIPDSHSFSYLAAVSADIVIILVIHLSKSVLYVNTCCYPP